MEASSPLGGQWPPGGIDPKSAAGMTLKIAPEATQILNPNLTLAGLIWWPPSGRDFRPARRQLVRIWLQKWPQNRPRGKLTLEGQARPRDPVAQDVDVPTSPPALPAVAEKYPN